MQNQKESVFEQIIEEVAPFKANPQDTLYKEMPKIETLYFNQLIRLFKNNGCTFEEVIAQLQKVKAKTLDLKKYVDPNSLGM